MANNSGKGTGFEYDVCQLFTEQNYFTRRSIPIRSTINQDITDVDVLGIKYTYPFEKTKLSRNHLREYFGLKAWENMLV